MADVYLNKDVKTSPSHQCLWKTNFYVGPGIYDRANTPGLRSFDNAFIAFYAVFNVHQFYTAKACRISQYKAIVRKSSLP